MLLSREIHQTFISNTNTINMWYYIWHLRDDHGDFNVTKQSVIICEKFSILFKLLTQSVFFENENISAL